MILLSLLLFYYYCFILLLLLLFCYYCFDLLVLLFYYYCFILYCFIIVFIIIIIIIIIVFVVVSFIIIIIIVLLSVRYFGTIVIYSSCFCILFGCSALCWTMIQSCDYDWISIFHVIEYMNNVWGSLELASKCQKPVAMTLLVWRLAAWEN